MLLLSCVFTDKLHQVFILIISKVVVFLWANNIYLYNKYVWLYLFIYIHLFRVAYITCHKNDLHYTMWCF